MIVAPTAVWDDVEQGPWRTWLLDQMGANVDVVKDLSLRKLWVLLGSCIAAFDDGERKLFDSRGLLEAFDRAESAGGPTSLTHATIVSGAVREWHAKDAEFSTRFASRQNSRAVRSNAVFDMPPELVARLGAFYTKNQHKRVNERIFQKQRALA
ncbi:hypothetical protein M885DRAFT_562199 [Pelagophyceae sp. CCMP2097]|nr:hypothetical protein M885DRAFT_562199 [Pelagophyceae sp. CCMP2097]